MELTGNVAGIIKLLGGGEGSTVTIEPMISSGLQIAKVTIDGDELYLYIPTPQDVDVDAVLSSGTKIAEITLNDDTIEIYAPSPTNVTVTPAINSGTKIADISVNGVNKELYAPGGGGVVYSLTEHIVGKWLDGRDIYERTYNIGSLSIGPIGTALTSFIDNHSDIDSILSINAISLTEKSSISLMSFISSYTNDIFAYAYRSDNWEYITLKYIKSN